MKTKIHITKALICLFVFIGCSEENELEQLEKDGIILPATEQSDPENEDSGILTRENQLINYTHENYQKLFGQDSTKSKKFKHNAHRGFTYICAKNLGLSEARAMLMREASIMPDFYQSGLDHKFNQQWSHAYMVKKTFWGSQWVWGDADDDFHDNILGDSGESESPEGYNGKWAGYYYEQGNRDLGDWYVGYACHFIEDINIVVHSTFPGYYMAAKHKPFEAWIDNNWSEGHNFKQYAEKVSPSAYYDIQDLKSALRTAVLSSTYSYSSYSKKAWDHYRKEGFPTTTGSGSRNLVSNASRMIEESTKWTGGAIKFALNKFDQW